MLFRFITFIFFFVVSLLFFWPPSSFCLQKEEELEIWNLISNTVRNISWLEASSPEELIITLEPFFTKATCREITPAAWSFVSNPTGWEYLFFCEDIRIEDIRIKEGCENNTLVHAVVIEYDPLFCLFSRYNLDFKLIKTESGWRISDVKCPVSR